MAGFVSKIHQGRYDSERELLQLRKNALKEGRADVLDAVHQRLKKKHPLIYQRLVGPLTDRARDKKFKCYCNNPKSLNEIHMDMIMDQVHCHSLICDDCWQEDITKTWGHYGWARKLISQEVWHTLCEKRAYNKYVE